MLEVASSRSIWPQPGLRPEPWRLALAFAAALATEGVPRGADVAALAWAAVARLEVIERSHGENGLDI